MTDLESSVSEPPRMRITWDVLEAAKGAGDETVIAACRRIIVADRLGYRGGDARRPNACRNRPEGF
jgi:hypothetical protein